MSFLTLSIHLCFGCPRGRLPGRGISIAEWATVEGSDRRTWPYHRRRRSTSLSAMGRMPSAARVEMFETRSASVTPKDRLSILVSIVLSMRSALEVRFRPPHFSLSLSLFQFSQKTFLKYILSLRTSGKSATFSHFLSLIRLFNF